MSISLKASNAVKAFRSYWLRDVSFVSLLIILIFVVFILPVLMDKDVESMVLFNIVLISIFFVGIWSAQNSFELILSAALFMIHLILKIIRFSDNEWEFKVFENVVASLNTMVFIFINFRLLFRNQQFNFQRVLGAVNVYLLIAMLGAFGYELVNLLEGSSIEGNIELYENERDFSNYIYFSLVSLTTVGYGDIFPANQISRMISVFLSAIGILFPAIVIARLVSSVGNENKAEE